MNAGENRYLTVNIGNTSGTLYVEADCEAYATVKIKNSAKISLANLENNEISIDIRYVDDLNTGVFFEDCFEIKVNSVPIKITGNSDIKMTYGQNCPYKFTVYGSNAKGVVNALIEVKINNKKYSASTDKNGAVTFKIPNNLKAGKYTISATYRSVTVKNTLIIKHLLKLKTLRIKKSSHKLILKASLKKGMKNKKIVFKFNGKKFKAKTNKKGVAKVAVKFNPKKVKKLTYQASYLKDCVKKTVKVA